MDVLLYGIGSIGSQIARAVLAKPWLHVVGAVEAAPHKLGKDLGEVIGLPQKTGVVLQTADDVLPTVQADVVVHATSSHLLDVVPQLDACLRRGMHVVSTCEELVFPYRKYPDVARQLDATAKAHQVTLLGTGINPGYLMDTLPLLLTAPCIDVRAITVRRMMYSGNRRDSYQQKIGTGLTQDAFERLIQEHKITGHVGLEESIAMIAATLNWTFDDIVVQPPVPVITPQAVTTTFTTVPAGHVCGLESIAYGVHDQRQVITLEFISHANVKDPYDAVSIQGTPDIQQTIQGGVNGDLGTVGMILNAIPKVVAAPAGFLTMRDLSLPSYQNPTV